MKLMKAGAFQGLGCLFICTLCIYTATNKVWAAMDLPPASDEELQFDNSFLMMSDGNAAEHVDLGYFVHRGGMMPGEYWVQVSVNDRVVEDAKKVEFRSFPNRPGQLYACVTPAMLTQWGIKVEKQDSQGLLGKSAQHSECPADGITSLVPWSTEQFDYNQRRLVFTVPQASLGAASRMRTAPSRWDEGSSALLMNYHYNGTARSNHGQHSDSRYVGIDTQLNLSGWRVRSGVDGYWNEDSSAPGSESQWTARDVYAQHDYALAGGGQFSVGKLTSDGSMVGSVPYLGVQFASDNGMLNPALTRYRPAITGIAHSAATVTVRQNGRVVYQKNVPQGPFSLTDFSRSGNSDVDVEIKESDGSERHFTMSAAVAPTLMSQGSLGYSLSLGRYQDGTGYFAPEFIQGNLSYGLTESHSVLAGALLSKDYAALSMGGGFYSPLLGAFSLTGQVSTANMGVLSDEQGWLTGTSGSMNWSRNIGSVAFGASATHYFDRNFYSFTDVQQRHPERAVNDWSAPSESTRNQALKSSYSLSLSQSFDQFGSVSLSGRQTEMWSGNQQRSYTLGYNTTFYHMGVGISAGYSRDQAATKADKNVALNLSIPLGRWLTGRASNVSGTYLYSESNGRADQQVGISGSVDDGALGYSVSQGWGASNSRNASVNYSAQYAALSGGYSASGENTNWSYSASGGVLVHPHGITLSRSLSFDGANALIEMPGVKDVQVGNVRTDWRGYAVESGLTPYDLNHLNVNMADLPGDMEIEQSSKSTVPTRGAVVRVAFVGIRGYRVLFDVVRPDGQEVPFGSLVTLTTETSGAAGEVSRSGVVGDEGQTYLSGLPAQGELKVSWGESEMQSCVAEYQLPAQANSQRLNQLTVMCH